MNQWILWALLLGWGLACGVEQPSMPNATTTTVFAAPEPTNWFDLHATLHDAGVPFAQLFTRIAIVETGWDFRSGVGTLNNLFGMQARPGFTSTENGYAVYTSRTTCVSDLAAWAYQDPPRLGETGLAYLHRRGWNPFPSYYVYLQQVNPWALTPGQQQWLAEAYLQQPEQPRVPQAPLLAVQAETQATTRVAARSAAGAGNLE
jgi:hypothetical protein